MNFADLFHHADETIQIPAGRTIIEHGEIGQRMYVLMEGEAVVRVAGANIYLLHAGELLGEMALIDHAEAAADVVAVTDCVLAPIDEKRFLFMAQQTPSFAMEVMKVIAQRLRAMNRLVGHETSQKPS